MALRSTIASRMATAVAVGSVQKYASQPSGSRTITTRIWPPAGRQVASKVLIVLVTRPPYWTHSTSRQPRFWPARLTKSIFSWP